MIERSPGLTEGEIWNHHSEVCDPEVPVLTVIDLGIVRNIQVVNGKVKVVITPTYSGCPAMNIIEQDINAKLIEKGIDNFTIETVLTPTWTTEWMSEEGKKKLKKYGIAPPEGTIIDKSILFAEPKKIQCPQCQSRNTKMISQFGSTPCKSLYQCDDCQEPFDYFKCH